MQQAVIGCLQQNFMSDMKPGKSFLHTKWDIPPITVFESFSLNYSTLFTGRSYGFLNAERHVDHGLDYLLTKNVFSVKR